MLGLVVARVVAARPELDAVRIDGFVRRHQSELEAMALAAGLDGLVRFREEHRLVRLLLRAAKGWLSSPGPGGDEIAALLSGILEHARFEEAVLFPFARELGIDTAHVEAEHDFAEVWLDELAAAIRAGRGYDGPAFAGLLHHFEEEEELLVGVRGVPLGEASPLIASRGRIEGLASQWSYPGFTDRGSLLFVIIIVRIRGRNLRGSGWDRGGSRGETDNLLITEDIPVDRLFTQPSRGALIVDTFAQTRRVTPVPALSGDGAGCRSLR